MDSTQWGESWILSWPRRNQSPQTSRRLPPLLAFRAGIIILEANDIVFAQILTVLHLD